MSPLESVPPPYRTAGPVARYVKACLQMLIGVVAVVVIAVWMVQEAWGDATLKEMSDGLFTAIGFALGAAAVVELAYTLFTHGADETLDPLMLAVSAALLIQLGKVEDFKPPEALAAALYMTVLAGLFVIRRFLAKVAEPAHWDLPSWWRSRPRRKKAKPPAAAQPVEDSAPTDHSQ